MRTATVITSAISLLAASASARIYGIAAPKTVAPGSNVEITILTENYIQSVQDVAIAFGLNHGVNPVKNELGQLLSSKYLGPDESNITTNITTHVTIPSSMPKGDATLTAFLFSLEGAAYSHIVETFTLTTTVGKFTSTKLVESS